MALSIVEFFGLAPLDCVADPWIQALKCPFVDADCIKPKHGACTLTQRSGDPVICCPNRLYAEDFKVLKEIAEETFGGGVQLLLAAEISPRLQNGQMSGQEVVVFGRYWGHELPLPRPPGAGQGESKKYYVDWILAKLDRQGQVMEFTAVEVQTIDTTGNYSVQAQKLFAGQPYVDSKGRDPGFSDAGLNWENVNKRILPQLIYKGHVLRRENKCRSGLYFVCPTQVYGRIRDRLGGNLHEYRPGNGTITFRSYELGPKLENGTHRSLVFSGQFTTTVDQVALAFTSPMNLPNQDVYEAAITQALGRASATRR